MFTLLSRLLFCPLVLSSNEQKPLVSVKDDTAIFDETIFTNPRSLDYDFSDDLLHVADKQDLYDELLKQLPTFNLYKLGKDRGPTEVPVITRQWDTWHTVVDSNNELSAFAPTTPSPRLTPTEAKNNLKKGGRRTTKWPSSLSSARKMKNDKFSVNRSIQSLPAESSTQRFLTSTTPNNSKTTWNYSPLKENKLRSSNSTRKSKKTISATMSTLSASSTRPLKTSARWEAEQPRKVFQSATTMGTRKKKIASTVSPRPGGIWRRGTIIFEETKPTSTATTTITTKTTATTKTRTPRTTETKVTTTRTTSAPVMAQIPPLADKIISGLRERLSTNQRRSQTRVNQETSPKLNGTHTHSPRHVQEMVNKDDSPKPVIIRRSPEEYKGPTFNCRILNPYNDGVATEHHDSSCPMSYPGFSKDGSCRCYYKVSSRDENGCAVGYLYACKPLWIRSVVV